MFIVVTAVAIARRRTTSTIIVASRFNKLLRASLGLSSILKTILQFQLSMRSVCHIDHYSSIQIGHLYFNTMFSFDCRLQESRLANHASSTACGVDVLDNTQGKDQISGQSVAVSPLISMSISHQCFGTNVRRVNRRLPPKVWKVLPANRCPRLANPIVRNLHSCR